jgi:hypothetical protein
MNAKNENLILKEVGVSATKGLIGGIPYIGTALNEVVFELRGRVKQKRVNNFIIELKKYMETINGEEINFNYIESEEFGDIFESIIKRIIYNRSEEKLHRFKKVLVKQMANPSNSDHIESFLDIISKINEKQIHILDIHKKIKSGELGSDNNLMDRNHIDAGHTTEISECRKPEYYDLDKGTYQFYVQDLISKALLADMGMNRLVVEPFQILEITKLGLNFLKFIETV